MDGPDALLDCNEYIISGTISCDLDIHVKYMNSFAYGIRFMNGAKAMNCLEQKVYYGGVIENDGSIKDSSFVSNQKNGLRIYGGGHDDSSYFAFNNYGILDLTSSGCADGQFSITNMSV